MVSQSFHGNFTWSKIRIEMCNLSLKVPYAILGKPLTHLIPNNNICRSIKINLFPPLITDLKDRSKCFIIWSNTRNRKSMVCLYICDLVNIFIPKGLANFRIYIYFLLLENLHIELIFLSFFSGGGCRFKAKYSF